jgi:ribosomal protein L15E
MKDYIKQLECQNEELQQKLVNLQVAKPIWVQKFTDKNLAIFYYVLVDKKFGSIEHDGKKIHWKDICGNFLWRYIQNVSRQN